MSEDILDVYRELMIDFLKKHYAGRFELNETENSFGSVDLDMYGSILHTDLNFRFDRESIVLCARFFEGVIAPGNIKRIYELSSLSYKGDTDSGMPVIYRVSCFRRGQEVNEEDLADEMLQHDMGDLGFTYKLISKNGAFEANDYKSFFRFVVNKTYDLCSRFCGEALFGYVEEIVNEDEETYEEREKLRFLEEFLPVFIVGCEKEAKSNGDQLIRDRLSVVSRNRTARKEICRLLLSLLDAYSLGELYALYVSDSGRFISALYLIMIRSFGIDRDEAIFRNRNDGILKLIFKKDEPYSYGIEEVPLDWEEE